MGLKEQQQQLVSEAVSKAAAQLVAALQQGRSEVLRNYLSMMGRFHKYSFLR
jgi:hypothetical protein